MWYVYDLLQSYNKRWTDRANTTPLTTDTLHAYYVRDI